MIFTCILYKYCLTLFENCYTLLMEDCCVCGNSVIFFSLPLPFLIDLFNKCYIDVKDCINCRDSIGKTLYRCNLTKHHCVINL